MKVKSILVQWLFAAMLITIAPYQTAQSIIDVYCFIED